MTSNVGSTLLVILNWNLVALNNTPCEYSRDGKYYHADCTNRNLINVPQNLDVNIESLDLSYNKVKDLDERYFLKYPNIKKLRLSKMKKLEDGEDVVQDTAFRGLEKLEFLDISDLSHSANQEWAPNLKILIANNGGHESLQLENLKQLEELYANNNSLRELPRFNLDAPLKIIELKRNPIESIPVHEIAPFCQVVTFLLEFDSEQYLQKNGLYCDCKRLQAWFKEYNIKNNPLNCTMPPEYGKDIQCPADRSEHEIAIRDECLLKLGKQVVSPMLIISLMFTLVIAALAFLLFAYVVKHKQSSDTNEDKGDTSDYDDDDAEEEDEDEE